MHMVKWSDSSLKYLAKFLFLFIDAIAVQQVGLCKSFFDKCDFGPKTISHDAFVSDFLQIECA